MALAAHNLPPQKTPIPPIPLPQNTPEMKLAHYLLLLLCFSATLGFTQSTPPDYFNKTVLNGQKDKSIDFLMYLEKGIIPGAYLLLDSSSFKPGSKVLKRLESYSKELAPYVETCKLSVVVVFEEPNFNTVRCRYYKEEGVFFQMDLLYPVGQADAPIAKIVKKSAKALAKALAKDRKRKTKYLETGGDEIPPPPPPPVFMEKH